MIYIEIGKNKETTLSFLPACFEIAYSSGDFIEKNSRYHLLYTLQICIIGVAVNLSAFFN